MEIAFIVAGVICFVGILKVFLTLAAFEHNRIHSPYLLEEERHRQLTMMKAQEDPRYFP